MATEKLLIDLWGVNMDEVDTSDCTDIEDILSAVITYLSEQPTVDAVEVVHGRWVGYHEADIGYDEYGVRCSNCNFEVEDHEVDFIMNYCPNCGAKMDGGADHEAEP